LEKKRAIETTLFRISEMTINPTEENNEILHRWGSAPLKKESSLRELLKRPEMHFRHLFTFDEGLKNLPKEILERVEIQVKYDGYIRRQMEEIERFKKLEELRFPKDFEFRSVIGLSREVMEKLDRIRPLSFGQASRISGITPAAISILMVNVKKQSH
jgi:tRNA uridine 5-carboxymethylaminomethyl modification enzyme